MGRVRNIGGAWAGILAAAALALGASTDEARTLWKTGKYAEAQEAYEALAKAADLKPADKAVIDRPRAGRLPRQPGPAG